MRAGGIIAIIDDDMPAREAAVSLVAAMGFDAKGFASASDFLDSSLRASVRCLISDVRMPVMSGLELYRHLTAADRAVPTILTTAYPDDVTRVQAQAAGVHGYLAKPVDPDELAACILKALHQG